MHFLEAPKLIKLIASQRQRLQVLTQGPTEAKLSEEAAIQFWEKKSPFMFSPWDAHRLSAIRSLFSPMLTSQNLMLNTKSFGKYN